MVMPRPPATETSWRMAAQNLPSSFRRLRAHGQKCDAAACIVKDSGAAREQACADGALRPHAEVRAAGAAGHEAHHAVELCGAQSQPGQPPAAHAHRGQVRAAHALRIDAATQPVSEFLRNHGQGSGK